MIFENIYMASKFESKFGALAVWHQRNSKELPLPLPQQWSKNQQDKAKAIAKLLLLKTKEVGQTKIEQYYLRD